MWLWPGRPLPPFLRMPSLRLRDVSYFHFNLLARPGSRARLQGEVAEAFAALTSLVWSGRYRIVSPAAFRTVLCKHAEQFSGYLQHDSQVRCSLVL